VLFLDECPPLVVDVVVPVRHVHASNSNRVPLIVR